MGMYYLKPTTEVQLGSVIKKVDELWPNESILTYNLQEGIFELSEISEMKKSESIIEYTYVKLNYQDESFALDTIVPVKNHKDELMYGYFTNDKPTIADIDPDKLVNVVPGFYKFFNGSEWVDIENVELFNYVGYLFQIKVAKNHSFFVENILISDYTTE